MLFVNTMSGASTALANPHMAPGIISCHEMLLLERYFVIAVGDCCLDLVKEMLQLHHLITVGAAIGNHIIQHSIERHEWHPTKFEPVGGRELMENGSDVGSDGRGIGPLGELAPHHHRLLDLN